MDHVERYRPIVLDMIERYAGPGHRGDIETEAVIDPVRDHYQVVTVGWDGPRRVYRCVMHLDIKGGKVWVQHNATDRPLGDELMAAGVPRDDIVLGFHPAKLRKFTEFAEG